jgi:hypothetical protein
MCSHEACHPRAGARWLCFRITGFLCFQLPCCDGGKPDQAAGVGAGPVVSVALVGSAAAFLLFLSGSDLKAVFPQ